MAMKPYFRFLIGTSGKNTLICMIFEYVILDFESSECKVDLYILVERELELFNFYIMLILI